MVNVAVCIAALDWPRMQGYYRAGDQAWLGRYIRHLLALPLAHILLLAPYTQGFFPVKWPCGILCRFGSA
jgi:hypothetical protein